MNHNYYYILLGKKAGGAAAASLCTSTSRYLRALSGPPNTSSWEGYIGNSTEAASNLAFGQTLEVWPSDHNWPLVPASSLFLDAALTQPLITYGSGWFQVEDQLFQYNGTVQNLTSTDLPHSTDSISAGDPGSCNNLAGPFSTHVWTNSDNWQTVTKVWADPNETEPFAGSNLWYSVEGTSIQPMGTTIQINNCGQVIGLYAC